MTDKIIKDLEDKKQAFSDDIKNSLKGCDKEAIQEFS
jgi:hypothetical protein